MSDQTCDCCGPPIRLCVTAGDNLEFSVYVEDQTGPGQYVPRDITGHEGVLLIFDAPDGNLIETLDSSGGKVIIQDTNGLYAVSLDPSDTMAWGFGGAPQQFGGDRGRVVWWWAFRDTDVLNDFSKVMARGPLVIEVLP